MKKMTAITFKNFNENVINYTSYKKSKIQPFCIAGLIFFAFTSSFFLSFLLHINVKSIEKISPRNKNLITLF